MKASNFAGAGAPALILEQALALGELTEKKPAPEPDVIAFDGEQGSDEGGETSK